MFKNMKFGCLFVLLLGLFLLVVTMLLMKVALTFLFKWDFIFTFLLALFAFCSRESRLVKYLKKIIKKVYNHIAKRAHLQKFTLLGAGCFLFFLLYAFAFINFKFIDVIVFFVVCIVSFVVEIFLRSKFEKKKVAIIIKKKINFG